MPLHHQAFCQAGDKTQALRLLASSSWFASLPDTLQTSLQTLGRSRALPGGDYLFLQGDPADGLYCVLQGSVLIGSSSAVGKNSVLARLAPGQWFGEVALFDHGPRTHHAHTDGSCLLWHVPHGPLLAWLEGWPQGWYYLGQLMAGKTRQLMSGLAQQTLLSPEARLAQRLLLLAGSGQAVSLSQEALASATGISRQTCNTILGQLADAGLIKVARKQLTLLDKPALQQLGNR